MEARAIIDFETSTDLALHKPKNNKYLNLLYKILNTIINM